jgi:hypothetical protein
VEGQHLDPARARRSVARLAETATQLGHGMQAAPLSEQAVLAGEVVEGHQQPVALAVGVGSPVHGTLELDRRDARPR